MPGSLFCLFALISPFFALYCYGFAVGWKAFQNSRGQGGEYAWTLRFLAVNLCEPLVTFVWLVALAFAAIRFPFLSSMLPNIMPSSVWVRYSEIIVFTAPIPVMSILLLPAFGLRFSNQLYRNICKQTLLLGLARWGIVILTWVLLLTKAAIMDLVLIPAGIWLLWRCIHWGKNHVDSTLLLSPGPAIAQYPAATTGTNAQPLVPPIPSPQPIALDLGPALPCPLCMSTTHLNADDCPSCGLVFVSRVPVMLHSIPGYTVLRPLGVGGMSSVYLAQHASDTLCVLKTLASVDTGMDDAWRQEATSCLQREAILLRQLDHPNIARVLDWIAGDRCDLLVLEYIAGPTLEQRLSRFSPDGTLIAGAPLPPGEALAYGSKLAEVLCYLASLPQPVIHCDIKPANLILPPDDVAPVLVDFGGAVLMQPSIPQTVRLSHYGTPGYAAPEQYHGDSSPSSDIYGLGATLYHLLTDDDPSAHPLHFPALTSLPVDIGAVLAPALERDPTARPDARAFGEGLRALAKLY